MITVKNKLEHLAERWPTLIGSVNRGRTLFKTEKDIFSQGHVAIKPGDLVTLLWGLASPIILRPRDAMDDSGFIFVGDAYVDGIMYDTDAESLPHLCTCAELNTNVHRSVTFLVCGDPALFVNGLIGRRFAEYRASAVTLPTL